MALAAVCSKAVALFLLIHCFLLLPLSVVLFRRCFCAVFTYSSTVIALRKRERERADCFTLKFCVLTCCHIAHPALYLFLAVLWSVVCDCGIFFLLYSLAFSDRFQTGMLM